MLLTQAWRWTRTTASALLNARRARQASIAVQTFGPDHARDNRCRGLRDRLGRLDGVRTGQPGCAPVIPAREVAVMLPVPRLLGTWSLTTGLRRCRPSTAPAVFRETMEGPAGAGPETPRFTPPTSSLRPATGLARLSAVRPGRRGQGAARDPALLRGPVPSRGTPMGEHWQLHHALLRSRHGRQPHALRAVLLSPAARRRSRLAASPSRDLRNRPQPASRD